MESRNGRRVVITGMGVIAPNGSDLTTFWESCCQGLSAAGPVSRFDTSRLPTRIAAEVGNFEAPRYLDRKQVRRFALSIQYAIAASKLAVQDGGLNFSAVDPERIGVIEGSTVAGMEGTFEGQTAFMERGYRGMSPYTLINAYFGGGSGEIALELGIQGHAVSYSSGSASGNDAIAYAASMIREDETDVMVAGGSEAPLLVPLFGAFCRMEVMTRRNEDPAGAMRPFDAAHDGFLLGEGAAYLVLEELSHALSRGARIYGEVAGHARSCEAYHSVRQRPDGSGVARAIEKALWRARTHPSEVQYINAHGTATEDNDRIETLGIKRALGDYAARLAVSSTKPVTGHLLGAAGALETIVCALALHHRVLPPTFNLQKPAEGCDLDYLPQWPRPYPVRVALNLNSGFGGKNSCLILKAFEKDEWDSRPI